MAAIRYGLLAMGIVAVLLLVPTAGQACPKCFVSAGKQVLHAYYVSVLLMALIPFGIVGSILAWLFFQKRPVGRGEQVQDFGKITPSEAIFLQEVPP